MSAKAFLSNPAVVFASLLVALMVTFGGFAASESAWAQDVEEDDMVNEYAEDADGIEYGRERFGQRCVYCHGGGGRGAKGPCLVCGKWKYGGKNEDLFYNIAAGIPNTQMGAFGQSLDSEEILKIMAYLRKEEAKYLAEKAAEGK